MNYHLENQNINEIQRNHYIDIGCKCKACFIKRSKMLQNGKMEKITHKEANVEYLANKIRTVNKLNQILALQNQKQQQQHHRKKILLGLQQLSNNRI